MKKTLMPILFCLHFTWNIFGAGVSDETNGLYVVVSGWRINSGPITAEPIRYDDELVWLPCSSMGEVSVNFQGPAKCLQIKMYDTNNVEVAKTLLGKSYGSKFDQFRPGDFSGMLFADGNSHFDKRMLEGGIGGRPLPAPKDLFNIKNPGIYTLEIRMQLLQVTKKDPSNTSTWSQKLVQFSPIKIKIEKPADD